MSEPLHPPAGAMSARRASRPPGPHNLSPLASAYAIGRDPMRFALDLWHRYGDVVHFPLLFWSAYALYHPDQVKWVLQENHRNYDKHFPMMKTVRPLFGNGLFTNDGDSWLHQRRLMQPSFHRKRLAWLRNVNDRGHACSAGTLARCSFATTGYSSGNDAPDTAHCWPCSLQP